MSAIEAVRERSPEWPSRSRPLQIIIEHKDGKMAGRGPTLLKPHNGLILKPQQINFSKRSELQASRAMLLSSISDVQ